MGKQRKPKRKSGGKQLSELEKILLATAILNLISNLLLVAARVIDLIK